MTQQDIPVSSEEDEAWKALGETISRRLAAADTKEERMRDPHREIPELVFGDEAPMTAPAIPATEPETPPERKKTKEEEEAEYDRQLAIDRPD